MWILDCKIKPGKIIVLCTIYALYTNYLTQVSDAMCVTKDGLSSCFQVTIVEDVSFLEKML